MRAYVFVDYSNDEQATILLKSSSRGSESFLSNLSYMWPPEDLKPLNKVRVTDY